MSNSNFFNTVVFFYAFLSCNSYYTLQTTHSPSFMGLVLEKGTIPGNLWNMSDYGSNIIIGMVDTGIWPERRSFSDKGLSSIPKRWRGKCVEASDFKTPACNKKIIGAKFFMRDNEEGEILSPRDYEGHGTHTASIAAGAMVDEASYFGIGKGRACGMAPKARLAIYKVSGGDDDIVAAMDEAVRDGVHIISISMSGNQPSDIYTDAVSIAAFGATSKGVFVTAAAGNIGPEYSRVVNLAPWVTTVGASTMDRSFIAHLVLADGRVFKGEAFYCGDDLQENKKYPLIDGISAGHQNISNSTSAAACKELDPNLARGKIVVCKYDVRPFSALSESVRGAGGVGIVIIEVPRRGSQDLNLKLTIPGLAVLEPATSREIQNYLVSDPNPSATIKSCITELGVKPAPVIADLSARGPNPRSVFSLKPDLIAPGYKILGAWTGFVEKGDTSQEQPEFRTWSGTSFSTPHISGIAALIKSIYPEWTPAMIHSALMTTSYTHGNDGNPIKDSEGEIANMWAMGAGHVDPEKALHPGLVYNQSIDDYLDFMCAINYTSKQIEIVTHQEVECSTKPFTPWNLNQPGIVAAFDPSNPYPDQEMPSKPYPDLEMVLTRKVTSVHKFPSTYKATLSPFKKAKVTIKPKKLKFKTFGETKIFQVRVSPKHLDQVHGNFEFGELVWFDGTHRVYSPVAVGWWKYRK
uniref:Uncharacterized protein n=1 Tax=Kalanchoe fedtschenkoi TaxID=63787 RepID=A0A7N0T9N6_KALFE